MNAFYFRGNLGSDNTQTRISNLVWDTWKPPVNFMGFDLPKIYKKMQQFLIKFGSKMIV